MRSVPFAACAALFAASLSAQRVTRGTVFLDANGNGVRDTGERGVSDVVVSNQEDVVHTDTAGAFTIAAGFSGLVFVSVPNGYAAVGSFWRKVDGGSPLVFGLRSTPPASAFTFVHASDTHLSAASMGRMQRFRSLVDSVRPDFTLLAGDLIRDAMSAKEPGARAEFELFTTEIRKLSTPYFAVPGNHDHFGIIPSRSGAPKTHPSYGRGMYREYLGPDYYSFTFGGIHFVGLNTLQMDDSAYYGEVDSVQMAWLERDIAAIPANMPVVTFDHIPLASSHEPLMGYLDMALVGGVAHGKNGPSYRHTVSNTLAVLAALKGHRLLLLGAHTHASEKTVFQTGDGPLRFEQSASIIGPDRLGPLTIPSGFTVYHVRNGEIDAGQFIPMDAPRPPIP